ncbi:ribonuclease HII [Paenibacillus sp. KN14-4R]|uniref:ribonuclease HII n=1 Tax=Paenibacillus sp. KN14-4R TaxID=3445773 RepID=UPI003F9FFFB6
MLEHEKMLWDQGVKYIAGVDEVGRGCLFGDVVAAAVILPQGLVIDGIDDSKKLSPKKREIAYDRIVEEAIAIGLGIVDVDTIERINIKAASRLAMKKAVEQLEQIPDFVLVDAETIDTTIDQMALIHGDAISQSIAAASIIAKVTRDRMCLQWDFAYPEYGIALHKGYGTKLHREKIIEFGPTPLHRPTFLRNILHQQGELF